MDQKKDCLGEDCIEETDKTSIGLETSECFALFITILAVVGGGGYLYYVM